MADELFRKAQEARREAYAPYSNFPVGAALETESGAVFVGCNVENASFGLTICAERNAFAAAVAAGHRTFRRMALSTTDARPSAPCGACRQVLAELAPELEILSRAGEAMESWRLDELLPARFVLKRTGGTTTHDDGRMDG